MVGGILMSRKYCKRLKYNAIGNKVVAVFDRLQTKND